MRISLALAVVAWAACAKNAVTPVPHAQPVERAAPPPAPSAEQLRAATKDKLTRYANEAFPMWAVEHPDQACPEKLADLSKYIDDDANDAWGRPLKMMCGAILPPGAKGIAVMSRGADGKDGTEDDVASWQ